jgi:hypothetical protein
MGLTKYEMNAPTASGARIKSYLPLEIGLPGNWSLSVALETAREASFSGSNSDSLREENWFVPVECLEFFLASTMACEWMIELGSDKCSRPCELRIENSSERTIRTPVKKHAASSQEATLFDIRKARSMISFPELEARFSSYRLRGADSFEFSNFLGNCLQFGTLLDDLAILRADLKAFSS